MPLTAAERQRVRIEKLKKDGKYEEFLKKKAETQRQYREKAKKKIGYIQSNRVKERKRKQRYRKKISEGKLFTPGVPSPSATAYKSNSALGKAYQRARRNLPKSPSKKKAVVRRLAMEVNLSASSKSVPSNRSKCGLSEETKKLVRDFYVKDEFSRQSPCRRDFIYMDGKKEDGIPARHLLLTIDELFEEFKKEHQTAVIGRTKFFELRPKHVKLSSELPHNVCTCIYHENFILAVKKLHGKWPEFPEYTRDFILNNVLCKDTINDCWMQKCQDCSAGRVFQEQYKVETLLNENCSWLKWEVTADGRMVKSTVEGTTHELYNYIVSQFPNFVRHVFIKRQQLLAYEQDKTESTREDASLATIQMDFSENYTCLQQDEIQSAHWKQNQITIFTVCVWHRGQRSYAIVSDDLEHTKFSVAVFTNHIIQLLPATAREVHFWTDGPSSQFKNRYIAKFMQVLEKSHNMKIVWNYFATSHGKGPVDGVGGALKKRVFDVVRRRTCNVVTVDDFVVAANSRPSCIQVVKIKKEEIAQQVSLTALNQVFESAPEIKGIKSQHCIYYDNDGAVCLKEYTFCDSSAQKCHNNALEVIVSDPTPAEINYAIGQWYCVYWEENEYWFIGQITAIAEEEIHCEFIHQTSPELNSFRVTNDTSWVRKQCVMLPVDPPCPMSTTRCNFLKLSQKDFEQVQKAYTENYC